MNKRKYHVVARKDVPHVKSAASKKKFVKPRLQEVTPPNKPKQD